MSNNIKPSKKTEWEKPHKLQGECHWCGQNSLNLRLHWRLSHPYTMAFPMKNIIMYQVHEKDKKTWEDKFQDKFYKDYYGKRGQGFSKLCGLTKAQIRSLFHQRDNEIREKILGMKKESVSGYAISERYLHQWIKGYNKAIDDLLTYLSNREV